MLAIMDDAGWADGARHQLIKWRKLVPLRDRCVALRRLTRQITAAGPFYETPPPDHCLFCNKTLLLPGIIIVTVIVDSIERPQAWNQLTIDDDYNYTRLRLRHFLSHLLGHDVERLADLTLDTMRIDGKPPTVLEARAHHEKPARLGDKRDFPRFVRDVVLFALVFVD